MQSIVFAGIFKYGHVVQKGASHSWAYKQREYNFSYCQVRVNHEKWASLPPFYILFPRLREVRYIGGPYLRGWSVAVYF